MKIVVDKAKDTPLYIQIRNKIRELIVSGHLKPGDKLPPVTTLSKEVGVTQATIRRALEDLKLDGHTECHVGRGTFIREPSPTDEPTPPSAKKRYGPKRKPIARAVQKLRSNVTNGLHEIMALADRPNIIKLTAGIPDSSLLPPNLLEQSVETAMSHGLAQNLDTSDPLGDLKLRSEIVKRAGDRGVAIGPENVLITCGSIQACSLLAQTAIGNKRPILFETPCYTGMANSFAAMGHWVTSIPRDQNGPELEYLEQYIAESPSFLYLCPYNHNPMGTNLSQERAVKLVDWAQKSGCTIIGDEIFKDLSFDSAPPEPFFNNLGLEQTIIISSLSKTLSPGLRIGWLISSATRINQLARLKRVMDYSTPSLMQNIAASLLTSGQYDEHVQHITRIYRSRMKHLLSLLKKHMDDAVTWTIPDGGFSILLSLPAGYSSVSLFLNAVDKGVAFLPGPLFDLDQRYINSFRLSCAFADKQELQEGVELLADAVEQTLSAPAGNLGLNGLGSFQ